MRGLLTIVVTLTLMTGCHARFKKAARNIDAIDVDTLTIGGVNALLGRAYAPYDPNPDSNAEAAANVVGAVAAGVFNVVQGVKEAELRDRIAKVNIERSNRVMVDAFARALGDGPPFAVSSDAKHLLQLELIEWGLQVPAVGVQGSFTYRVRARLYDPDGRTQYKTRMTCEIAAGDPSAVSQGLFVVNNAKQVKQMTLAELQDAFDAMANYCGTVFVTRMRRHAS